MSLVRSRQLALRSVRAFSSTSRAANAELQSGDAAESSSPAPRPDEGMAVQYGSPRITDIHKSVYPTYDNPRRPEYPTHFKDAPLHKHVNYPLPILAPRKDGKVPETLGENTKVKQEILLSSLTGLSKAEFNNLTRFTPITKRVVNMTKKGKM